MRLFFTGMLILAAFTLNVWIAVKCISEATALGASEVVRDKR